MRIAIYGGSFNPPHLGHLEAARSVASELNPDKFLIIPDNIPPHKSMEPGCPTAEERLELCRLNFRSVECAEISDIEIKRQGKSYTADTIRALRVDYPEDEIYLVIGSDMLLSFEEWYDYHYLFANCRLAVVSREEDDMDALRAHRAYLMREYNARIELLSHVPLPMSSGEIRVWLRLRLGSDLLDNAVYASIIKNRYYDAEPELCWLREAVKPYLTAKRVAHVAGCESEAVRLAMHYGENAESAAEAGALHDITKKLSREEQLILCEKYGIILDKDQLANLKLLHAITGAELARDEFGVSDEVYNAIRWHTTGKPDMTLLEKIIYMADYIEPTRDFPGVDELRELAYSDLDAAMRLGLEMSLEDVKSAGVEPHKDTVDALRWYTNLN